MNSLLAVKNLVWDIPTIVLLLATGGLITYITGAIQVRKFFKALKLAFCNKVDRYDAGELTHLQSLHLTLCATVGSGNIVGIATAITLGGIGSIFWMWVAAFLGMATKYAEALLSVKYRTINEFGEMVGGSMYYLKNRLQKPVLAFLFAIFAIGACLGIGSSAQGHAISSVVFEEMHISRITTGIIIGIMTLLVTIRGINSLKYFVSIFAPIMILLYCGFSLFIICSHPVLGWNAFKLIFTSALSSDALTGGMLGVAIRYGIGYGVFSNEAGMGSTAIAAACAKTGEPSNQALVSMIQVFVDTFVICTLTALIIIMYGPSSQSESIIEMVPSAFSHFIGPIGGKVVLISLVLFSFSTICGWEYYGEKCIDFLLGYRAIWPFKIIFLISIFFGAKAENLDFVLGFANTFNGLMTLPNLVALILFAGVIKADTKKIK
ncbi:MAG: amino acid carrier protein [Alphaproteobacteria bacterium]|nr:amino acid carrier protein [Alphaproteobacteria bacterium]